MPQTPKLGVLQLKTTFPRPPGDVGNPLSWPGIPVVIRVVEEADSDLVVGGGWGEELVAAFVREAQKMREEEGCVAFLTSCGFVSVPQKPALSSHSTDLPLSLAEICGLHGQLATMHPLLAARLPFMGTTSLLQVAWLQQSFFPGPDSAESVGVITYKKSALTTKHLTSVGAHPDTPVYGLPEDEKAVFKGVLEERIPYDFDGMAAEVITASRELVKNHTKVQAIVLECTNMPPFTKLVEKETGRKVWDILTLGRWLYNGAAGPDWKTIQTTNP